MKALFVGVFSPCSTNISQLAALGKLCEVVPYDYRKIAKDLSGNERRDKNLIHTIEKGGYDFVLTAKGQGIASHVFSHTRKWTRHILWYMDTLNSNFNNDLLGRAAFCESIACAWKGPFVRFSKEFLKKRICLIPEGYDADIDWVKNPVFNSVRKVGFIGAADGDRARWLRSFPEIEHIRAYGMNHCREVQNTDININFTRKGGSSDRVFKVLASGGFLLTEPWQGMGEWFEPGSDFAVFDGPVELRGRIQQYLDNTEKRKRIAQKGHESVKDYSRDFWAKEILKCATIQ